MKRLYWIYIFIVTTLSVLANNTSNASLSVHVPMQSQSSVSLFEHPKVSVHVPNNTTSVTGMQHNGTSWAAPLYTTSGKQATAVGATAPSNHRGAATNQQRRTTFTGGTYTTGAGCIAPIRTKQQAADKTIDISFGINKPTLTIQQPFGKFLLADDYLAGIHSSARRIGTGPSGPPTDIIPDLKGETPSEGFYPVGDAIVPLLCLCLCYALFLFRRKHTQTKSLQK